MPFSTLVDTDTLVAHLQDPAWVIVDCRFALDDERRGEQSYRVSHIPGAVYAHLDRDLSGEKTGTNGRHPLPTPAALTRTFERLGIGNGMQVVAYDQDSGSFASRLWWLLRWMGHDAVAVLDGGYQRWTAENRPTESGAMTPVPTRFVPHERPSMLVDVDCVSEFVRTGRARLVDARAPERFRGDMETIDKAAGHIPGAVNYFFRDNLRGDGTFRPSAELRERWTKTLAGAKVDDVVCYCGSGVTACQDLLALEHAGLTGAKLYPGSWSEWTSDPTRPIATGDSEDAAD